MQTYKLAVLAVTFLATMTATALASAQTPRGYVTPPRENMTKSLMLKPSQLSQGSGPSFESLDVNHDKFISRSEVPKNLTALRAHFAEYDRDGDHRLTPQEYMTYSANQVEILTQ